MVLHDMGREVMVHVADHGVGIPENELKYIYDPFFRASNVRDIKGFGIGLPLANKIMSLHQGRIQVQTIENQGTVFELRSEEHTSELKSLMRISYAVFCLK